jgi:hypothetical protein
MTLRTPGRRLLATALGLSLVGVLVEPTRSDESVGLPDRPTVEERTGEVVWPAKMSWPSSIRPPTMDERTGEAPWPARVSWPSTRVRPTISTRVGQPIRQLSPRPGPGRFGIELYRDGDFVSQATKIWCVPAAMQTMVNIMAPAADRSAEFQERLYGLARLLSTDRLDETGAEPEGWAGGLERLGFGRYEVAAETTREAAVATAARAIRMTGRPAGLLVWGGAHAWVMSGFRSTADPAYTAAWEVTHVAIQDVWYPRVSSIWGASRPPGALVPVGWLGQDYLPWRRPHARFPEKDGRFVVVLPVPEPAVE